MAYQIPTQEPDEVVQGDTWKWKKFLGDYPPATWTLTYTLVKDDALITFSASDNGDGNHLVTVAKATTAAYESGTYKWQSTADDGTDRHLVASGTIEVKPDYSLQVSGFDARSHYKKMLDALEAMEQGRATKDQLSYSIGDRSITRLAPSEVLEWTNYYRSKYKEELRREKTERGLQHKGTVLVNFPRTY